MPTPGQVLLDASSLTSGTPWQLLNSIDIGPYESIALMDGLEIAMEDRCVDVELELEPLVIEIDTEEIGVQVETPEYTLEIC